LYSLAQPVTRRQALKDALVQLPYAALFNTRCQNACFFGAWQRSV
jgi:hypothetical protein